MGGTVCIATRDKDVATALLDAYGFDYRIVGRYSNLVEKALSFLTTNYNLLKLARDFNPHLFIGAGSIHAAHVARILNRIYVSFDDTEGSAIQHAMYQPFATRIYTPRVFRKYLGRNQVFYEGYHEMSYLLPKYFSPNPDVLSNYGLNPDESFFILRLVSWNATHDRGQKGIDNLSAIVEHLGKYGIVFVSAESKIASSLDLCRADISPVDMPTMLAYARMYIGEGATMASESATLGTPAIFVNTQKLGYIDALVEAGLIYHIKPSQNTLPEILDTIDEIMTRPLDSFKANCRRFLSDKIDVVEFIMKELIVLAKRRYSS
jgi:predicted glycosyltransferase